MKQIYFVMVIIIISIIVQQLFISQLINANNSILIDIEIQNTKMKIIEEQQKRRDLQDQLLKEIIKNLEDQLLKKTLFRKTNNTLVKYENTIY